MKFEFIIIIINFLAMIILMFCFVLYTVVFCTLKLMTANLLPSISLEPT